MQWFVYYHDDFFDNGGVGFMTFDSKQDAVKFIEERLGRADLPDIANYTVVCGDVMPIHVVERISRITLF